MKKLLGLLALAFVFASAAPARATEEEVFVEEDFATSDTGDVERPRDDEFAWWQCSAQAPRLIRVFTVREEGYKSDVQAKAVGECQQRAVLQCWPLGCRKLRR